VSDYYDKVCRNLQAEGLCHPPSLKINAPLQMGVGPVYSEAVNCEEQETRQTISALMMGRLADLEQLSEAVSKEAATRLASVMHEPFLPEETDGIPVDEAWPPLFAEMRQRASAIEKNLRAIKNYLRSTEL